LNFFFYSINLLKYLYNNVTIIFRMPKKVYVDSKDCIGCTLCTQICPNVFEMQNDGKSKAIKPDGDTEEKLKNAIDSCPVGCIHWEK